MASLILSKAELARAFQVSENTIGHRTMRGLRRLSGGRPGIACEYEWDHVEPWVVRHVVLTIALFQSRKKQLRRIGARSRLSRRVSTREKFAA